MVLSVLLIFPLCSLFAMGGEMEGWVEGEMDRRIVREDRKQGGCALMSVVGN